MSGTYGANTGARGFTLDDAGRRVEDGWDHDGDLAATLQAGLNRLQSAGDELAAAAARIDRAFWETGSVTADDVENVSARVNAWRSAIGSPTTDEEAQQ